MSLFKFNGKQSCIFPKIFCFGVASAISVSAYASAYQAFLPFAYDNPATLNLVHKSEVDIGTTEARLNFCYTGIVGSASGKSCGNDFVSLPYGRFAYRFSPKIVASFDISHPANAGVTYDTHGFSNMASIATILHMTDYGPKISYQVNDKLAVGAGFDANRVTQADLSFAVPPNGTMSNTGSSWAYGWNVGLSWVINAVTFFNASYFSKISHSDASGLSTWGPVVTHDSLNITLPATWTFNLIRFINPKWLVSGVVRYIQWNSVSQFTITNSAIGTLIFPLHWHNTWNGQVVTRYQFLEKWAVLGGVGLESNPSPPQFEYVGLAADKVWVGLGGFEYNFTKELSAQLAYIHLFSNTPINQNNAGLGPIAGTVKYWADALDLKFTWKL